MCLAFHHLRPATFARKQSSRSGAAAARLGDDRHVLGLGSTMALALAPARYRRDPTPHVGRRRAVRVKADRAASSTSDQSSVSRACSQQPARVVLGPADAARSRSMLAPDAPLGPIAGAVAVVRRASSFSPWRGGSHSTSRCRRRLRVPCDAEVARPHDRQHPHCGHRCVRRQHAGTVVAIDSCWSMQLPS